MKLRMNLWHLITAYLIAANALPSILSEEFKVKVTGVTSGGTVIIEGEHHQSHKAAEAQVTNTKSPPQANPAPTEKTPPSGNELISDRYKPFLEEFTALNGTNMNNLNNTIAWLYEQYIHSTQNQATEKIETGTQAPQSGLCSKNETQVTTTIRKQPKVQI